MGYRLKELLPTLVSLISSLKLEKNNQPPLRRSTWLHSNVTLHIISQFVTSLVMLAWIFVLVAGYHVAVKMVDTMEWSAQLDQMQYVLNADICFLQYPLSSQVQR